MLTLQDFLANLIKKKSLLFESVLYKITVTILICLINVEGILTSGDVINIRIFENWNRYSFFNFREQKKPTNNKSTISRLELKTY